MQIFRPTPAGKLMITNTLSKSRTNSKSIKIAGSERRNTLNSQTPNCCLQALWRLATLLTMHQLQVGQLWRTNPAYPVVLREYLRRHSEEDPESPSPLFLTENLYIGLN